MGHLLQNLREFFNHAALHHARERRQHAQDRTIFDGDVTSAFDMGTVTATNPLPNPYVMKGNARIGVSFSVNITAGQLTLATEGARTLETPALDADVVYRLDYLERARTLTPTCAIAGTVSLHVFDEWMLPSVVATGVFT